MASQHSAPPDADRRRPEPGAGVRARVLVVEDERSMREFLQILLERNAFEVTLAADGRQGIARLEQREFDVVLTDLKMPGSVDGLGILARAKELYPSTEVIVITAFATADTAIAAMKDGAYDYLTKPFKVDEIIATLDRALEKRSLVRATAKLRAQLSGRYRLEDLVGRSGRMQAVFDLVRRVAETKTSVLVMGESGTGKELVARAIHAQSARSDKPFVAVNCGAIPETLMESELFGHVRGAFTGANADKVGLFLAADGGSIFLDEIAELPPQMQVKLLRTLQELMIKPVGGVAERKVDVRVIAATNRNLDEEVAAGRFRSDLFYRLNVIPIILPPLRERREDVPLLADHFLDKHATALGKPVRRLTPGATKLLAQYHYPGNVRELENLIERAVALSADEVLDEAAFPQLAPRHTPVTAHEALRLPEEGLDLDAHLGDIEQQLLLDALARSGGNRTDAARILGISLRSLRYRLAKYGRDPGDEAS